MGYNKIMLAQPFKVPKGSFVLVRQITAKLAIDSSLNFTFSDLFWTSSIWSEINEYSNLKLYLNTINNFTSYYSNFNLFHPYVNTDTYNITITFLSSNQVFCQTVEITDCEFFI